MAYGENLSAYLGLLGLRNKDAADKIGISYNTLSNILNNKFSPSEESHKKIVNFLTITLKDFSEEDLEKDYKIFQNIRIRSSDLLSGLEKAQFRDDFNKFNHILEISDLPENKSTWIESFEYCNRKITNQETFLDRRKLLMQMLNNKRSLYNIINDYFLEISKGTISPNFYSPICIIQLLDSLGIRRFFLPFKTEKISSFSTSLTSEYKTPFSYLEQDPVIVINERVCNTTEKCLFEMAKQFYFMISSESEYNFLSINKIQIENPNKEKSAICFAEKIFINKKILNHFIHDKKRYFPSISPIDKSTSDFFFNNYDFSCIVNEIKKVFQISYELAIEKLFESDFEYLIYFNNIKEAKEFYLNCLKRNDEKFKNKTPYRNGEPEPLPISSRGYNYANMITNFKDK